MGMVMNPRIERKFFELADRAVQHGRYAVGTVGGRVLLATVVSDDSQGNGCRLQAT